MTDKPSPLGDADRHLDPRQAALLKEALKKSPGQPQLLDTGQEEVFSRTEVETGRVEHRDEAGKE